MRYDQLVHILSPQEVKMLVMRDLFSHGMSGKLLKHDFDVDQAVTSTIYQDDRSLDVASRVLGDLVVFCARCNRQRGLHLVIEHLESFVPDNLEPVDDRLGATEGEQVRISCQLLVCGDVLCVPAEQVEQSLVDDPRENAGIEQCLPHGGTAQNCFATEK